MADRWTVVAYDPRGNSWSTFEGAPQPLSLDEQADDAAALIAAMGSGPADIFGTSGGAQIGLNLAARHPDLVRALVAHEPPAMMLLDDPSAMLAADEALYDTYRRDGVDAAMGQFFAENGLGDEPEEGPAEFDMSPEAIGNLCPSQQEFRILAGPRHAATGALSARYRGAESRQTKDRGRYRRGIGWPADP
ncbi:alpha/beta hydrolase [Devosia sp. A8/3-2]|nr:alpha/beta hydrolase [Devosia sp. A8/3-2]